MTCTSKRPRASELSVASSRRNSGSRRVLRVAGIALLFFAYSASVPCVSLISAAMQPQNTTEGFRTKFTHENDPVHKARILMQLGDAEFRDIQKEVGSDNAQGALAILQQYRDEAQACQKDLEATGRDPEKHPNGFKELQISLRESLRRLDHIIADLSGDEQKSFRDVRQDLEQMDLKLIHQLFPRRPEAQPKSQPDEPKPRGGLY